MTTLKDDPLSSTLGSTSPERLKQLKEELFDSSSKHMEAANRFQAGLDKVIDVLLILVLKFGRATTMLLANGIFSIICLVTLVVATVQIMSLRSEMKDLMDRQEEFAKSQQRIERTTNDTQKQVTTASKQVEETSAKVDTVAETAPKVELDPKTGKAKLVVTVPPKPSPKSSNPPPAGSGRKLDIKLE